MVARRSSEPARQARPNRVKFIRRLNEITGQIALGRFLDPCDLAPAGESEVSLELMVGHGNNPNLGTYSAIACKSWCDVDDQLSNSRGNEGVDPRQVVARRRSTSHWQLRPVAGFAVSKPVAESPKARVRHTGTEESTVEVDPLIPLR